MCITVDELASAGAGAGLVADAPPPLMFRDPRGFEFEIDINSSLESPGDLVRSVTVDAYLTVEDKMYAEKERKKMLASPCANATSSERGVVSQDRGDVPCYADDESTTKKPACYGQAVFAELFRYCYLSGTRRCENPACLERKKALEKVAPACRWTAFREQLLIDTSCVDSSREFTYFSTFMSPLRGGDAMPAVFCLDVLGIVDLWMWYSRLFEGPGAASIRAMQRDSSPSGFRRLWKAMELGRNIQAAQSSTQLKKHGFCLNRLWNIAFQSENGVADIPPIVSKALELPVPPSKQRHAKCTEEHCLIVHENSTLVSQAHKCEAGECSAEAVMPTKLLNVFDAQSTPWEATAWQLPAEDRPLSLLAKGQTYMAVSHVWSDGTGVGMKTVPGCVNKCLLDYFVNVARQPEVDCEGLWWDAISIPTERRAKAAVMDSMLEVYEHAKVTVIHDQELHDLGWSEDGGPAVSLILSSWFTRGWTAAELWASRSHRIKVLFKNPDDPTKPLIKDLDDDILANGLFAPTGFDFPFAVTGPACMIASDIVGLFRSEVVRNQRGLGMRDMQELRRMLQTRTTSWARDRTLIAALMCLPRTEIDSTTTEPEMTQRMLTYFGSIRVTDLINHRIPINSEGPWDWAPQSIFDLGQQWSLANGPEIRDRATILPDGSVSCKLLAFEVLPSDVVLATNHHPALEAQLSIALSRRETCLLLATPSLRDANTFILFQPTSLRVERAAHDHRLGDVGSVNMYNDATLTGRWVACVSLRTALDDPARRNLQTPEVWDSNNVEGLLRTNYWNDHAACFVFGRAPLTSQGGNLPPLSFDTTLRGLGDLRRGPRSGIHAWNLVDEFYPADTEWPSQPVYLYSATPREEGQEEGDEELNVGSDGPAHPMGSMALDPDQPKNWVRSLFWQGLTHSIGLERTLHPCPDTDDEACPCIGTVELTWSFPPSQTSSKDLCAALVPLVYRHTFHVTNRVITTTPLGCDDPKKNSSSFDLALGATALRRDIIPATTKTKASFATEQSDARAVAVRSTRACGKCGKCVAATNATKARPLAVFHSTMRCDTCGETDKCYCEQLSLEDKIRILRGGR